MITILKNQVTEISDKDMRDYILNSLTNLNTTSYLSTQIVQDILDRFLSYYTINVKKLSVDHSETLSVNQNKIQLLKNKSNELQSQNKELVDLITEIDVKIHKIFN